MSEAGELQLQASQQADGGLCVQLRSTRPQLARLLIGREAGVAAALLPRLYSICAQAQGRCAALAMAAARGDRLDDPRAALRLAAEQAGEHLWRLWLDWPALLGLPQQRAALAAVAAPLRSLDDAARAATLAAQLREALPPLEALLPDCVAQHPHPLAQLFAVLAQVDAPDTAPQLLPTLPLSALSGRLLPTDRPEWSLAPRCDGEPAEASALGLHRSHALVAAWAAQGRWLVARLAARCVALNAALQVLAGEAAGSAGEALPTGVRTALACVPTARGPLLHQVGLDAAGRVAAYAIAAPTEWNFQPEGGCVRAASRLRGHDAARLELRLRALLLSLDPCVPYRLQIDPPADPAAAAH